MINNELFSDFENNILNIMVSSTPKYREILCEQLNNSNIKREKTQYYCLTFIYKKNNEIKLPSIPNNREQSIILEMIIDNKNKVPTDILLYSKGGYVCELEIYNADSSEIDYNMKIENYKVMVNLK